MSTIYRQGLLRGDKIQFPNGTGCCIWYPLGSLEDENGNLDPDNEESGICFDFSFDDIDDLIALLQQLKTAKADIYQESENIEDTSDPFCQNIPISPP